MSRIFISYRRDDTAADMTDRLYEQLVRRWGRRVFMDIDSLVGGDLFAVEIERNLQSCAVVLVVIGREWLSLSDGRGGRRIDDPGDYPRMEVAAALRRGIRVIPVLVGNAILPQAQELPADIAGLADRQVIRISRERFEADVRQLIAAVAQEVPGRSWRVWMWPGAAAGLVAVAVATGLYLLDRGGEQDKAPPTAAVAPPAAQRVVEPVAAAAHDGPARPAAVASGPASADAADSPVPQPPAAAKAKQPGAATPAVRPRVQRVEANVSGTWTTALIKNPYSVTDTYTLLFEITQQGDLLLGTVTERRASRDSTRPIVDGRIKDGVLSFHTQGEVSGGPNGGYVPFKQHYVGQIESGKRQISFRRFNDVITGGEVQRFVAEPSR